MSRSKTALSFVALVAASGPALAEDTLNALVCATTPTRR